MNEWKWRQKSTKHALSSLLGNNTADQLGVFQQRQSTQMQKAPLWSTEPNIQFFPLVYEQNAYNISAKKMKLCFNDTKETVCSPLKKWTYSWWTEQAGNMAQSGGNAGRCHAPCHMFCAPPYGTSCTTQWKRSFQGRWVSSLCCTQNGTQWINQDSVLQRLWHKAPVSSVRYLIHHHHHQNHNIVLIQRRNGGGGSTPSSNSISHIAKANFKGLNVACTFFLPIFAAAVDIHHILTSSCCKIPISVLSSQLNIVEINFLKSHVTYLTSSNSRSKANSSTKISVWNLTHGDKNLKSVSDRELDRETDLQNAPPAHPLLKASESESTLRDPNLSIVQGVESETCRKTGNRIIPERETLDRPMCYRRKTPHTPVFEIKDNIYKFPYLCLFGKHLQNEEKWEQTI